MEKGGDEERRAQQQQRQVVMQAGADHLDEDGTGGSVVAEAVTDEQPRKNAARIAGEEHGGQRALAERFLRKSVHRGAGARRSRLSSRIRPGR